MWNTPNAPQELGPLTDSLCSVIRWRREDYGAILRAELELLVALPWEECADEQVAAAPSGTGSERGSPARRVSPDRGG